MEAVIPTARPNKLRIEKNLSLTAFLARERK
jgi:hypothetical protein